MAYQDNNTPVIEKITLPSGNTYFIADREIRDVVDTLSQTVAGGVSYNVAWDGTSEPTVGNIPAGVTVTYEGTTYTGTMVANNATPGAFYLVKSTTQVDGKDVYDEYVPVGPQGSKTWEKIGDTQIDLSNVVTNVSLTKQTDTVIGTDATFTLTNPTITPTIGSTSGTGKVNVITGVSASKTNVKATASGANTAWNSKDQKAAITGLGTPSTENAVKSVSPTTKKLAVTTVTGVSGSTTPNVVKTRTSQTTADGNGTASTTNTDWLKGVSVSNGVLTIGAATMDTQTTYSADAPSSITIPTAAGSATTVATGSVTTSGSGADVVTDVAVGDTFSAVTGYESPTTANVIGASSTFTITQPTVALETGATAGTGVVNLATDASGTTEYVGIDVTGGSVAWNNKDSVTVLTNATDVSVTKGGNA